jgi:DNA-directed RNA polymerase subunit beta'
MTLCLASPEHIRERSFGEVTSPGTLNRQTYTPERGGLFCEVLFGPVESFECQCGRVSGIGNINLTCGKCKVDIVRRSVRRERMGHIDLGAPIVHPWYFKQRSNKIGRLLGIKLKDLRDVIYYRRRLVVQPGSARHLGVEAGQLLTEDDYHHVSGLIQADDERSGSHPEKLIAKTGGEAVLAALKRLDLGRRSQKLRYQVRTETSQARRDTALKRLRVVERFREAARRDAHEPEWMVLRALPVTPPDLRPLVPLEKGGFATSDLNDLYRRVIIRNNRLKGLIEVGAPESILHDAKRLVQKAVDELLDKGTGSGRGAKKSLSDQLKGKEGRFRQDLLGKRVDFSGRSVIVAGPELELHQCGLPRAMAYELYRPFLIGRFEAFIVAKLVKQGIFEGERKPFHKARRMVSNVRKMATVASAREQWSREAALVDDILRGASEDEDFREDEDFWEDVEITADLEEGFWEDAEVPTDLEGALEEVMQGRPVLLNRQPTLHRLGIQAFQPVLTDEKAIRLHPLVCTAYNADFDGDQMAAHVPLSEKARREVRQLMRPVFNILSPAHGEPLAAPTQDMILGLYYMTKPCEDEKGEGKRFASTEEVRIAYDHGAVDLRARVELRDPEGTAGEAPDLIDTTVGRVLFNSIVPEGVDFVNEVLTKKNMRSLIARVLDQSGYRKTARFLDDMKALGFERATTAGLTFSLDDLVVPDEKAELVESAAEEVDQINASYDGSRDQERYERVIALWTEVSEQVSDALYESIEEHKNGFNAIYMMADSGARGSQEQIRQLGGMRGLMAKPQKSLEGSADETIENPILSNFKEGLSVQEYFISTHGARKGLADTALKTGDAGYLTRRLIAVAQNVTITEVDCGTKNGVHVRALRGENDKVVEPKSLGARIAGRVAAHDIDDPHTGERLVATGELIGRAEAESIAQTSLDEVEVRSLLTCETSGGVCARCYGHDLTTRERVEIGERVGAVAAQSIGEPGTQLILRTFHTGGVVEEGGDITGGLPRVETLLEAPTTGDSEKIEIGGEEIHGDAHDVLARKGRRAVQQYLIAEVQKVYASHGVSIDDKHVEIVVRKMTEHVEVTDPGDTELLEGEKVSRFRLVEANDEIEGKRVVTDPGDTGVEIGHAISQGELRGLEGEAETSGPTEAETREARRAVGEPVLLGITKAALAADSWVAAASFQETPRMLTDAAVRGQEAPLRGMMESVVSGNLTEKQRPAPFAVRGTLFQIPFRPPALTETLLNSAEFEAC